MERDLLLGMLNKAKNLLAEDESILRKMDDLFIKNNNAQSEILAITQKSYKKLTLDEFNKSHPLPDRGDFESYKTEPNLPLEKMNFLYTIAAVLVVLGIIYTIIDGIIPFLFISMKSWKNILIDIGITIAAAGSMGVIHAIINRNYGEIINQIIKDQEEKDRINYDNMLAKDQEDHQREYDKACQQRDSQIQNSLKTDEKKILELAGNIEKITNEAVKYKERHDEIWNELDEDVLEFYPPDQLYAEAAEAFYKSVYNLRADTIKEAVNQYVESQEWEKTRELQKQQIEATKKSTEKQIQNANNIGKRMEALLTDMENSINRVGNGVEQLYDGVDQLNDSVQNVGENIKVQTSVIQKTATFEAMQRQYNASRLLSSQYQLMNTIREQGNLTRNTFNSNY